jgi:hypothetical protein
MSEEVVMLSRHWNSHLIGISLASALLPLFAPSAAQVLSTTDGNDIVVQNQSKTAAYVTLYENAAECTGDTANLSDIEPGSERTVKVTARPEQAMLVFVSGWEGCKKIYSFPMGASKKYAIRVGDGCSFDVAETSGATQTTVAAVERKRLARSFYAACKAKE